MRETINYYYNVYPKEIHEIDNGIYFYYHDFKYYFIKYERNPNEIDLLVKMSNDLYSRNILVDTFILTKDNTYYVVLDEITYVLIRVNGIEEDKCSLKDIVYFNNLLISKNIKMNEDWATLWEKKIDEFELEMSDLNKDYPLIQETFDYYVGLGENAIAYFKDTLIEDDINTCKVNLNHKRIDYNVYNGYIVNPITFTFDYEVRDIAEYIKAKFFKGMLDIEEVYYFINTSNLSRCSLRLLYARLLYPSYYFDTIEHIFIYEDNEEKILEFTNRYIEYEDLLIDIYNMINKKVQIPPIDWLINKD